MINPRVITIDYKKKMVGLSLRPKREQRNSLKDVEVGQEMLGKVKSITSYGAFIDIGCTSDALVHISRISVDMVSDINDHLTVGEVAKVRIIKVDVEKKSMAASMLPEITDEYLDRRNKHIKKMIEEMK